jgi:hypothetical protein
MQYEMPSERRRESGAWEDVIREEAACVNFLAYPSIMPMRAETAAQSAARRDRPIS